MMLCSYQATDCSYLDDLTGFHNDFQHLEEVQRSGSFEQIVPGNHDNLREIEPSLYSQICSMKSELTTEDWPCTTVLNVERQSGHASSSPPTYNDHMRFLQEEERRILTSSPTYSDISVAGMDTDVQDLTEETHLQSSDLLGDIMECIQKVDKSDDKHSTKKGTYLYI